MIKRTLCFSNPAMLSLANSQLVVKIINSPTETDGEKAHRTTTIPIEDIGIVVLDHPQITITHGNHRTHPLLLIQAPQSIVHILYQDTLSASWRPESLFIHLTNQVSWLLRLDVKNCPFTLSILSKSLIM